MRKLRRMFRFVKPYRWRLVFFLFTAVGYSVMTAMSIIVIRQFFTVFLKTKDWSRVYFIIRSHVAEGYLANVAVRDATNQVMAHVLKQQLAFYDRWRSGELMSRTSHDAEALGLTVRIFTAFVREPISVMAVVAMLLVLSWKLTLVCVVGFPIAAVPVASTLP